MKRFITIIPVLLFASGLFFVDVQADDYKAEIDQWHQERISRLQRPDGWLSLAGLFWLKEGENRFGSDAGNDIRFPEKAPAFIGSFFLKDGVVSVAMNKNVVVLHNKNQVTELALSSDKTGDPTILQHGSLLWTIIDRNGKMGVRLKDRAAKAIADFNGIDRFPVDPAWRIKARLDTVNAPKVLTIPSVLGMATDERCPGALVFIFDGKEHRLYPISEPGESSYFLIFADATNGSQTYGAGRFLSVPAVDEKGETFIDFNKAYNPPCAFTPYATCPLPPRGNSLDFPVTAGEKKYGTGHSF